MEESLKAFEDYENDLEKSRPASADELKKKAFRELDESKRVDEELKLRDHFAGLAMQGFISHYGNEGTYPHLAEISYKVAYAMIKARKEVKP